MAYALCNDLSFCMVDGRPVFLDMRSDRYFQLQSDLEHRFIAYANENQDANLAELVARNILEEIPGVQGRVSAAIAEPATQSALERHHTSRLHVGALVEVLMLIYSAKKQLRSRPLKAVIDAMVNSRPHKSKEAPIDRRADRMILQAADEFNTTRAYVPVETRCLLDSIAMLRFLARRGHHANLVFGVTSDPFSAHCWVQTEGLVLNDTVGHANAYTPIRVV